MRSLLLLITFAVCLSAALAVPEEEKERKQCQQFCTYEHNPVCGYDGNCYQTFGNQCAYNFEKCSRKSGLETVDISLCTLAAENTHPNYKTCN